ncbi:MAG: hypothetical protein HY852_13100 [Bradyrhizobium sp.]|uniref:hypothetical protein n=1 Tax=Bradyrhizobium sp. TaxID=376 RepID=UPI0025BABBAA|nr:hypothetical protein [Bradyrhizobium sp.]MBI5262742.1 hypothetical protein [Bradyrhizobium sp.]
MLSEHKRVKHGQQPGDLPRRTKIRMREKSGPIWLTGASHAYELGEKVIKSFRRILQKKGKKVQRRRDKREIERQLDDDV